MRFAYSIQQKMKIAMLLFFIMGATILIRVLEDKSVNNMSNAFVSMYKDRLIPATDLFFLAENVYGKRYLLEEALAPGVAVADLQVLQRKLGEHNKSIDSLVRKYEGTFLIKKEKTHLNDLKTRLRDGKQIEDNIIVMAGRHSIEEGRHMFESVGKGAFDNTVRKLSELSRIQTDVGEELIRESNLIMSGKLYSAAQLGLAILIGVLIVGIVFASNVVNVRNDKFNLN